MRLGMCAAIGLLTATSALAQPAASDPLAKIGHIVVIFEENRSFDNFFGKFPGANGFATAGDLATADRPRRQAVQVPPRGDRHQPEAAAEDTRFPAQLPNQPFEINPYVSLEEDTGDLIHAFYQEQMQINGGAMNRFAEVSNAKGLVMGYFDISRHLSVEARRASSRWAMRCSTRRSAARSSTTRSWSAPARSGVRTHRKRWSPSWMPTATW